MAAQRVENFEELLAIPDKRAARIAGASLRQVRYWEEIGLVRPSIRRAMSRRKIVRLYRYQDLLELLVVATLRVERGMTLQHVRRVIDHLHARGYTAPLRDLVFATKGTEIYFQHPDGEWEGDVRPDQIVLEETIKLDRLRSRIKEAATRAAADQGRVVKRRGVKHSQPIFAGTRIPVAAVQRYLAAGYDTAAILEEYPSLSEDDVETARNIAS